MPLTRVLGSGACVVEAVGWGAQFLEYTAPNVLGPESLGQQSTALEHSLVPGTGTIRVEDEGILKVLQSTEFVIDLSGVQFCL